MGGKLKMFNARVCTDRFEKDQEVLVIKEFGEYYKIWYNHKKYGRRVGGIIKSTDRAIGNLQEVTIPPELFNKVKQDML